MKVARIHVENFKRFGSLDIPVTNRLTEAVAEQFLILGDNGAGKTSVLQAVALCLSMAANRTPDVEHFDWVGWLPGRYERWGKPVIELEVHFTQDEIEATREAAQRWWEAGPRERQFVLPGDSRVVNLRLEGQRYSAPGGVAEVYQFGGRAYAAQLLRRDPSIRDLFDRCSDDLQAPRKSSLLDLIDNELITGGLAGSIDEEP